MYVHAGVNKDFIWHHGTKKARATGTKETKKIWKTIEAEIERDEGSLIYSHKVSAIYRSQYHTHSQDTKEKHHYRT